VTKGIVTDAPRELRGVFVERFAKSPLRLHSNFQAIEYKVFVTSTEFMSQGSKISFQLIIAV
jgi:hypothetical protein